MKQFYTLVFLCTLISAGSAQNRPFNPIPLTKKSSQNQKATADAARSVIDTTTVFFPTWNDTCSNSFLEFVPNNAWGRVAGMNQFMDIAKAQKLTFSTSGSYTILGGIGFFSWAVALGNGLLNMDFYSVADDGSPGDLLATSISLNTSALILPDTLIRLTLFGVLAENRPTLMDSQFFASIHLGDLYATADSVAVFQTAQMCGSGSDTWEQIIAPTGDTIWTNIGNSVTSWGLMSDFAIAAVIEFDDATSDESYISSNGLTLYPAYPNPSHEKIFVNYELEQSGPVSIDVFDVQGKIIQHAVKENVQTGLNQHEINLNQLSPGNYYYLIATDQGRIASRFVVQ